MCNADVGDRGGILWPNAPGLSTTTPLINQPVRSRGALFSARVTTSNGLITRGQDWLSARKDQAGGHGDRNPLSLRQFQPAPRSYFPDHPDPATGLSGFDPSARNSSSARAFCRSSSQSIGVRFDSFLGNSPDNKKKKKKKKPGDKKSNNTAACNETAPCLTRSNWKAGQTHSNDYAGSQLATYTTLCSR